MPGKIRILIGFALRVLLTSLDVAADGSQFSSENPRRHPADDRAKADGKQENEVRAPAPLVVEYRFCASTGTRRDPQGASSEES